VIDRVDQSKIWFFAYSRENGFHGFFFIFNAKIATNNCFVVLFIAFNCCAFLMADLNINLEADSPEKRELLDILDIFSISMILYALLT
jgi:hypothetical protein